MEREPQLAGHQTGHNSNVIHSGLYYAPGGLKARLAVAGCAETVAFCREHDLPHRVTGKLVVATEPEELPRMAELARRGPANGVEVHELDQAGMREHEPHVRGIAALHVPSTGICDYRLIAEKLGELVVKEGGEIHLGRAVTALVRRGAPTWWCAPTAGTCSARRWWPAPGCAATSWPGPPAPTPACASCPFRGEYSELRPPADDLVKGLIYPVPDPAFPFLGVHATRGIDGTVHAGPNAVLALAREGYDWRHRAARRAGPVAGLPGHAAAGPAALAVRARGGAPLAVPVGDGGAAAADAARRAGRAPGTPAGAGVRAQAVRPDGGLVDDFLFVPQARSRAAGRPGVGAARAQRAVAGRHRGAADRPRDPGATHRLAPRPAVTPRLQLRERHSRAHLWPESAVRAARGGQR